MNASCRVAKAQRKLANFLRPHPFPASNRPRRSPSWRTQDSQKRILNTATMIIPIRCFSCGKVDAPARPALSNALANPYKVTADLWERYVRMIEQEGMMEGYVFPPEHHVHNIRRREMKGGI
jgi:DNA-directed RNA polymerase subunit N (RpoN/RPB10)